MKISETASQQLLQLISQYSQKTLSVGDRFTGRILSMENGLLLMQLSDGNKLSVQGKSGEQYQQGDLLQLEVIEQNNEQLFVRHVKQTSEQVAVDELQNRLAMMKLPVDQNRVEIVKAMLDMGIEPSAEVAEKSMALMDTNQAIEPRHAVFLVLNGMEEKTGFFPVLKQINEESFHFVEKWQNLLERITNLDTATVINIAAQLPEMDHTTVLHDGVGLPKVDQWLKEIEKRLGLITEAVSGSGGVEAEKILPQIRELQTAVQFFQDITSYEAFVQVPFMMREDTTQGELYIMKRKGARGKVNADDFSLFLSLSTKNLGVMDAFVHVRSKNVLLRVMMDDERFYEPVMNEYKPLYETLQAKGFRLVDLKFTRKDEKVNLLNAARKAAEITGKNRNIDIKV